MRSLTKMSNERVDLDIKLSDKDIQALKRMNLSMGTTDYIEFLDSVNSIAVDVRIHKCTRGERFELP